MADNKKKGKTIRSEATEAAHHRVNKLQWKNS